MLKKPPILTLTSSARTYCLVGGKERWTHKSDPPNKTTATMEIRKKTADIMVAITIIGADHS